MSTMVEILKQYNDDIDDNTKVKVIMMMMMIIHPKNKLIGGDYLSAQKNWRKKCVNLYDKILGQTCVNHPNVMNFVAK